MQASSAWGLFIVAALLAAPSAVAYHGQPGRAGLVVDGPVELTGAVVATSSPGAAFWTHSGEDLPFDLKAARVDVEWVKRTEPAGPLAFAMSPQVTREKAALDAVDARLTYRGAAFQLLAFQSGPSLVRAESPTGGTIVPHPPGGVVPTLDAQRQGLDAFGDDAFLWGLRDHGARFESDSPSVLAMGDFTIFLYDAGLRARHEGGSVTYRTGVTRDESTFVGMPDDAAANTRTVSYLLLHVRNGQLAVGPNSGFVALYGGLVDATLNGTARLASARGTATVGGERIATEGPTALVGVLEASLYPTPEGKSLRMDASGDVAAFAVPGSTHEYAPPILAQVSFALFSLAAIALFLKSGGLAWLYSRIAGSDALRHEDRERALAFVRVNAGATVVELAAHLDISWSTASYHLSVLQREGMLASARSGRHRRFFLVGCGVDRGAIAVSAHPTAQALLAAIRGSPGATQTDLAAVAGITPSTASWHLKRLAGAGLVTVEKQWRERLYRISE